jgi:predicted RNA-binding protein Jag
MAAEQKLRIKQYFGSAVTKEMTLSLEEAKTQLSYFWTKDGSANIIISIDGQTIKSFEDLVKVVSHEPYSGKEFVDIGVFFSNDGSKSIWPKR